MWILRLYLEVGLRFNGCGFYEGVVKVTRGVVEESL
jgi:hypothetical protein